jgi:hypothetical protein
LTVSAPGYRTFPPGKIPLEFFSGQRTDRSVQI